MSVHVHVLYVSALLTFLLICSVMCLSEHLFLCRFISCISPHTCIMQIYVIRFPDFHSSHGNTLHGLFYMRHVRLFFNAVN